MLKYKEDDSGNIDALLHLTPWHASKKQVAALKQRASAIQLLPDELGAGAGAAVVTETAGGEGSEEIDEKIAVAQVKVQGGSEEVDEKLVEQANAKLAEQVKVHKVRVE